MQKIFKKSFYFILITVAILTTLYLSLESILIAYAKFLKVDNPTKGADAILILAGSSSTRAAKAIELLESNYSNRVLLTSPKELALKYRDITQSDSKITEKILKFKSIEYEKIPSIKDGATSTFDEAYDFVALLNREKIEHLILVTDSFHSRRAKFAFDKILKLHNIENVKVEVASAENSIYSENNWWRSELGIKSYVTEFFTFILYLFNSRNLTSIEEI